MTCFLLGKAFTLWEGLKRCQGDKRVTGSQNSGNTSCQWTGTKKSGRIKQSDNFLHGGLEIKCSSLHARIRDFLSLFLKESRLMFSVRALPTHSDHWTKKGIFTAEGKKLEASSFHQNKGETRTQQHQPLREKKAQAHGRLAAPLASGGTSEAEALSLPAHPCHASRMSSCAGMAWEPCFSFLGKGCKAPNLGWAGSRSPDNLIVGFLSHNPRGFLI